MPLQYHVRYVVFRTYGTVRGTAPVQCNQGHKKLHRVCVCMRLPKQQSNDSSLAVLPFLILCFFCFFLCSLGRKGRAYLGRGWYQYSVVLCGTDGAAPSGALTSVMCVVSIVSPGTVHPRPV